ncbi:hypothetical protein AMTR_s00651p00011510 [Amborella trichopoda]|uniref:Uncharacterized protein n=1 Tax=Amborella trichopoda TaxID=13333 RepID=W1NEG2_AMBTC|nr:hypothetical protein AMTR_s00651p00011510 [Amborella trichopoda]
MAYVVASILKTLSTPLLQEAIFLYGIGEQVDRLKAELRRMNAFLKDVDMIGDSDERTKNLVEEIRDLASESENIIEMFVLQAMQQNRRELMGSLRNYACLIWHLRGRHEVGTRIEAINNKLGDIARARSIYDAPQSNNLGEATISSAQSFREMRKSSPLKVERDLVGIEKKVNSLKESLLDGEEQLSVVFVVGKGELTYSIIEILRGMISKVVVSPEGLQNMNGQRLKEVLHTHLRTKKYLIVLDGIWDFQA